MKVLDQPIRVLLVDDHAVVRAGIRQFLEQAEDIKVITEGDDGAVAKSLVELLQPDVAVLDIQMPQVTGIEVTRWIRAHHPDIGILVLTAFDDDPYFNAALQAGVNGYVLKTAAPGEIIRAVRSVHAGNSALDATILQKMMSQVFTETVAAFDPALWTSLGGEIIKLLENNRTGSQAIFSAVSSYPVGEDPVGFVAAPAEKYGLIAVSPSSPVTIAQRTLAGIFGPGEQSTAFVVDPDHRLNYQTGNFSTPEYPQSHPGAAEAMRGDNGNTYIEVDGIEHVVTCSPILPTGWALVIEEPWEAVAYPLLTTTQLVPLVLVPVLLLYLVALWFGARQIVQPLQELEARSTDLAWGNYDSIAASVGGIDEITHLKATLVYLAQKIQSAQAGLHSYIEAITTGQEDERQRFARELYDGTIQALIALNQRMQLTQLKLAVDPQARAALEEIQTLTEETIQDLRRVIRYDSDLIQLTIADDGSSFDMPESPAEFASKGHFGLLGIYERTELIGASFSIETTPDFGTKLVVRLTQVDF